MNNDTAGSGLGDPDAPGLWDELDRARTLPAARALSRIEDALFRHYLPIAGQLAREHAPDDPDREGVRQDAEVGLAQAILSWRQRDSARFDRFARAVITEQLHRRDRLAVTTPGGGDLSRPYGSRGVRQTRAAHDRTSGAAGNTT